MAVDQLSILSTRCYKAKLIPACCVRAVASTTRVRRKHAWQNQKSISLKSSKDQKDGVCSGSQTELEYLVVSEIISCCNHYVRKVFQQITIEGKAFEME